MILQPETWSKIRCFSIYSVSSPIFVAWMLSPALTYVSEGNLHFGHWMVKLMWMVKTVKINIRITGSSMYMCTLPEWDIGHRLYIKVLSHMIYWLQGRLMATASRFIVADLVSWMVVISWPLEPTWCTSRLGHHLVLQCESAILYVNVAILWFCNQKFGPKSYVSLSMAFPLPFLLHACCPQHTHMFPKVIYTLVTGWYGSCEWWKQWTINVGVRTMQWILHVRVHIGRMGYWP